MTKISICIPTFNRAKYLANCLHSIRLNNNISKVDFEVCVSDNCSEDNTEDIVIAAQKDIPIVYCRNSNNIGRVKNYLNVVEMAKGDFVWMIGDDDLLLPNALHELNKLISTHENVDFFYINSFCQKTEYVMEFPQPFDTSNLPNYMPLFSSWGKSKEMNFMELINPKISFDFLGGMYLAVFKRKNWIQNTDALDAKAILDIKTFSHFDNTFPHVKIFSKAFSKSKAYFHFQPLSVNLSGVRDWSPLSPLVNSIRLIEALDEYRINGLSVFKYILCKNYALRRFIPDLLKMMLYKGQTGIEFINPIKVILLNCLYPNFYLSIFYFFIEKIRRAIK